VPSASIKGRDQDTALLLSVSRADAGGKRRGLRVWSVGTSVAKQAVDQQFARWVMLHVQSNPLPICTRPRVLIKGKRT
jgi:Phage major capsid protein E